MTMTSLKTWSKATAFMLALFLVTSLSQSANAQQYSRIQNFWKPNQELHTETGQLRSSPAQPNWWSAQWIIENAPAPYVRFKNRHTGLYIHNEYGNLQVGNIQQGWHSAMWELIPVAGESFVFQIRNRWKGTYINIERGLVTTSNIQPGWHSARWYIGG